MSIRIPQEKINEDDFLKFIQKCDSAVNSKGAS